MQQIVVYVALSCASKTTGSSENGQQHCRVCISLDTYDVYPCLVECLLYCLLLRITVWVWVRIRSTDWLVSGYTHAGLVVLLSVVIVPHPCLPLRTGAANLRWQCDNYNLKSHKYVSASEMTYIVSSGALNSTHSPRTNTCA